eukprot:GILJ01000307.1.p1 GENE.GILJ01000307.1~~GILJ01000307.1.p1  ORF type:complete len:366 (-),score=46.77 GILJ01000307.1:197-1207(-)
MTVSSSTDGYPEYISEGYQSDYVRVNYIQLHTKRRQLLLQKHPELNSLMHPDVKSAFWCVGIVLFQLLMTYLVGNLSLADHWFKIFLLAYVVGACADHAMWVLVHDLTHNAVFESDRFNQAFHIVANLPLVFPSTMNFRYYHLQHHSYLNETYTDPDMPSKIEADIFGTTALGKALWLLLFPIWQSIRVTRYGKGTPDAWIVINFIIVMAYNFWCLYMFGYSGIFYMCISSLFAIGLHPMGARWVAEHYAMAPTQETYSYYGPANLISFNIGYHNEHHDLARVPWSKLPVVRKMAPEFYDKLVYHSSYVSLLFEFIFNPQFTLKSRVVRDPYKKSN